MFECRAVPEQVVDVTFDRANSLTPSGACSHHRVIQSEARVLAYFRCRPDPEHFWAWHRVVPGRAVKGSGGSTSEAAIGCAASIAESS
jgi:hypothetical protein